MLGGPWGIEDASCPNRENPPVPSWHARGKYRFQVGLGDDLIGYEKPAWSFLYDTPGPSRRPTAARATRTTTATAWRTRRSGRSPPTWWRRISPACSRRTGPGGRDPPRALRQGGRHLTDAYSAPQDQGAPGHFPAGAVAIWLAAPGSTTLDAAPGQPDSGTIVALDSVGSFGNRGVDYNGRFMDFDGAELAGRSRRHDQGDARQVRWRRVQKRYYVDVYPALTVSGSLGPGNPPPSTYPRPGGATPLRVSLVPEFRRCTNPNSTHVGPLDNPSCTAPTLQSSLLTTSGVGRGSAFASYAVTPGNTATPQNEADVKIGASATDVRNAAGGSDYAGKVILSTTMRITDRASSGGASATVQDARFDVPIDCAASPDPALGSACAIDTTANTLVPGFAQEGNRAVISAFSVSLEDAGPDGGVTPSPDPGLGCPPTCGTGDESVFLRQGVFAP